MRAGLAVDTDADLDFILSQIKAGLADRGNGAGVDGHAHGTDIGDDLLRNSLDFRQVLAGFGSGTGDLVYKDGAGDTAAAGGPCAVLDRDVIRYDDLGDFDVLIACHISGHFKVHDITGVVLDDQQSALAALCSLDGLIDLVGCRGGKYRACYSRVQHAQADEAAVGRLMAGTAA